MIPPSARRLYDGVSHIVGGKVKLEVFGYTSTSEIRRARDEERVRLIDIIAQRYLYQDLALQAIQRGGEEDARRSPRHMYSFAVQHGLLSKQKGRTDGALLSFEFVRRRVAIMKGS